MVEKFTKNVSEAAQRELSTETANRLKSVSDISLNLIKPEIIRFVSKFNALIDKYFSIPADLVIDEAKQTQNTPETDSYEMQCKKDIAELELVYKQQAHMINQLKAELDLYDDELMTEAELDMGMCDLFEKHFGDCSNSSSTSSLSSCTNDSSDTLVINTMEQLSNLGIDLN